MGNQNNRLTLIVASISVVLLVGLIALLLWSEGTFASKGAAWESLENAIITLMGEYPDKPKTIVGRIVQLLLLVFSTFAFGAIVGKVSSFFVTRALQQENAVKQFNDHIIICNWNDKAPTIVNQLLEANQESPKDIVVISASIVEDQNDFKKQNCVHFIQADPTHHDTLEKFQAPQAKSVILLADEATEAPDEKNALIALAVKHLEQNPDRQGTQLTDQPEDAPLRAEWDAIANRNLDLLENNLSTEARSRLGRYNPTDSDRWKSQVNDLFVSSKALYDLADARFSQLFPGRVNEGFVETPVDQIWFALAQDQVNALESGNNLTEITFEQGSFSHQQQGNLDPGQGHVYILNLSAEQLLRLNLQAPPDSTRLSIYVPVPNETLPHILADAEQNTWAGELPQSGYYEVVVVSRASEPIPYSLTTAVDNVIDDIINRPDPPEKDN
ncbi:hypothetical protein C8255_17000 [filamentous cyanobacterium CCP3]|nr:hypothetical protein C8255_17000 [filamentous cyanobacterium CCP3]